MMEILSLFNINNQEFLANVVRFFELNGNLYLIFHKNETDMQGYIVLYTCKVVLKDGKYLIYGIDDENEWANVKTEIQKIVLNNRKGIQNETDKDFKILKGTIVSDYRMFKLKNEISNELGSNKKAFNGTEDSVAPVMPEVTPVTPVMSEVTPVTPVMPEVAPVAPVMSEVTPVTPAMPEVTPVTPVMPEVTPVSPVMPEVTPVMPEVTPVTQINNLPSQDYIDLKEKYEKLLNDYEIMKSENLNLVTDNARLHTLINEIKNIIA